MKNINLILENIPEAVITLRLNYDDSTLIVSELDKVFQLYLNSLEIEYIQIFNGFGKPLKKRKTLVLIVQT